MAVRAELGLYPTDEQMLGALDARREDKRRILETLRRYGLFSPAEDADGGKMPLDLVLAIHRYLAQCDSRLMVVQLEDILDAVDQANLPGTTTEYPNWRRKVGPNLDGLAAHPRIRALAEALRALRPGMDCKARG